MPGTAILLSFMPFLLTALCGVCTMHAPQTPLSTALSVDLLLEQHTRDAVFRAVCKNEMASSLLYGCNPSEALP